MDHLCRGRGGGQRLTGRSPWRVRGRGDRLCSWGPTMALLWGPSASQDRSLPASQGSENESGTGAGMPPLCKTDFHSVPAFPTLFSIPVLPAQLPESGSFWGRLHTGSRALQGSRGASRPTCLQ